MDLGIRLLERFFGGSDINRENILYFFFIELIKVFSGRGVFITKLDFFGVELILVCFLGYFFLDLYIIFV